MPRYSSIHEKPLTKEQRDKQVIDAKVQKEKQMIDSFKLPPRKFARPSGASRSMSEMSEVVLPYDIPQHRIDFLLRQLRLLCYRKVKGNGSDVSVREVFRHFDANKDEDDEGNAGIDGKNLFPPCTFILCSFLDDTLTESASHVFRCDTQLGRAFSQNLLHNYSVTMSGAKINSRRFLLLQFFVFYFVTYT